MSMPRPHGNCYVVAPRLLAGEYPFAVDVAAARDKLRCHLDAGVTCFIDLTEPAELLPYAPMLAAEAAARGVALHHRRLPIRDGAVPEAPARMTAILDAIDEALAAGHTVYVHCFGGIGRTGTVVGCWLVRHGQGGEQALSTLAARWSEVDKRYRRPQSPETEEQRAYVRAWSTLSATG